MDDLVVLCDIGRRRLLTCQVEMIEPDNGKISNTIDLEQD
jgi:hypothetical protein